VSSSPMTRHLWPKARSFASFGDGVYLRIGPWSGTLSETRGGCWFGFVCRIRRRPVTRNARVLDIIVLVGFDSEPFSIFLPAGDFVSPLLSDAQSA